MNRYFIALFIFICVAATLTIAAQEFRQEVIGVSVLTEVDDPVSATDTELQAIEAFNNFGAENPETVAALETAYRGNPDYPEVPSTTTATANSTTISGMIPGIPHAAKGHDPRCFDPTYWFGSNCKRICGDLPVGKSAGPVLSQTISPPDYARFAEIEVYSDRSPVRVCAKGKNWAQHTAKRFTFTIRHQ